ncbi:hypothetical protein G6F31_017795 [Rhizopus arrhizus]|nr:hypothetical protein G6F31_017795 [Rhizopus arrhizus]
MLPDDLVAGAGAVGHKEAVVGVEDARGIAFAGADGAVVVQQLAKFLHRVADIGAQHVFAKELVEDLADRAFQEGDAARVAGAMPGIRTVFRVVEQRFQEGRLDAVQIIPGFTDEVARDELGRVLEHVDDAVQLAQDVIGTSTLRRRTSLMNRRMFCSAGASSASGVNSSSSIDRMKDLARLWCCASWLRSW